MDINIIPFHVLIRQNQSVEQLKHSLALGKTLDFFPKIGGSIAVISGLVLYFLGNYGTFMQLWLLGSLIVYILIQVTVIGIYAPTVGKLVAWVYDPGNQQAAGLTEEMKKIHAKANRVLTVASTLGVLLFVFMIMKP